MSCPDEPVLARYADGELAGDALRRLEAHLIGCRACRTRVVALQSESLLLADVLQGRERSHAARSADDAPEPGAALGVPIAIAAVTAALAVGGFLVETQLPGGLDLLNPLRLLGVTDMAFDLIFALRVRAPGLVEGALALAGVASVSALLSFGVGAVYRRVFGAGALALCLLAPDPAAAFELRHVHDGDLRIGADETVEGTLVASSESLQLDGVVDGDLVVFAERVYLAGTVRGDVYAFARNLEIIGRITGSLVGVTEQTDLDGEVEGSLYQTTGRLDLGPAGRVGRDAALFSRDAVLAGRVGRDLLFAGPRLEIRGEIARHVLARWRIERLTLLDPARVGGDVEAWVDPPERLERASGARVAGAVRVHAPETAHDAYWAAVRSPWVWAVHAVGLAAAFVFGLIVHALAPALLELRLATARDLFVALGTGFAALVVTPIALLLLALTLVGLPLALLGSFGYLTALYLAEIVTAAALGRWILPPRGGGTWAFGRALLVGLAVLVVVEHLPYVGVPVFCVAVLIGLGGLATRARHALAAPGGLLARPA